MMSGGRRRESFDFAARLGRVRLRDSHQHPASYFAPRALSLPPRKQTAREAHPPYYTVDYLGNTRLHKSSTTPHNRDLEDARTSSPLCV